MNRNTSDKGLLRIGSKVQEEVWPLQYGFGFVCVPMHPRKGVTLLCIFLIIFFKWRDILWSRRLTLQLQNLFMRNPLQVVEVVGKVGHLKSKAFHFGWPVEGREGVINLVISNLKSFTPYHHHQLNQSEGLTIWDNQLSNFNRHQKY